MIECEKTGKVIHILGGGGEDKIEPVKNGQPVRMWKKLGCAAQLWREDNGRIVNPSSGKCLDIKGRNKKNGG